MSARILGPALFLVLLAAVPASGLETSCTGSACCLLDFTPGANCTANDLTFVLAGLGVADDGCVDVDDTVSILLRAIVENTTSQTRYDVGIWVATDGDPNADGALTGECAREILGPPSGVLDSTLCADVDLTCGSGPYYDADLDSCGDLRNQGSSPDCGQTDDVTLAGDGPCTLADGSPDASVLDFATPVVFACNDTDLDGFANLDICLSYGNQADQVDFGGGNSQCDSAAEIEPGTNAKCQCEDNFNTNIPAADLDLSCSCAGSTVPGGFSTCTLTYTNNDLPGCVPDLGTQERFRCGSIAYARFTADYDEANLSVASTSTLSGTASDDGSLITWNPASGLGTANILGEGDSGSLTIRFDVDAMAPNGTYSTNVATLWSNSPGFGQTSTQALSTTCSFAVGATWASVTEPTVWVEEGGLGLQWETAGELEMVGFEVERWVPAGREFQPITTHAVPALGDGPGGRYRILDASAPTRGPVTYRLVEVDRRGGRQIHGPWTLVPTADRTADGQEGDGFRSVTHRGDVADEVSWIAAARESNQPRRAAETISQADDDRVAGRGLVTNSRHPRLALEIDSEGIVEVDSAVLADGLGWGVGQVEEALAARELQLSQGGEAVAWELAEGGGGLRFFGQPLESIYTRTNVYWLEPGRGLPMVERDGPAPRPTEPSAGFSDTVRRERDLLPRIGVARDPESDYWFWSFVITGHPDFGESELEISLASVAPVTSEGLLAVDLWGFDAGPHHARIEVNGVELGDIAFAGAVPHRGVVPVPQGVLDEGLNQLVIEGIEGVWFVDGVDWTYQRLFEAENDQLLLRSTEDPVVSVTGFSTPEIAVYEVSDPRRPVRLRGLTVDSHQGAYRVSFETSEVGTPYRVVTTQSQVAPAGWRRDYPSRWLSPEHRVDYLVISPTALLDGAHDLASYRAAQGLRTAVVDLQDLYDEVSDGIATPEAIRGFLEVTFDTWRHAPRYVLLVGDGSYDYQNRLGLGGQAVPPLMVPSAFGLVPGDQRFADPGEAPGAPRQVVGRLPVLEVEQIRDYLDKIRNFEQGTGEWTGRVLVLADNPDPIGDFVAEGHQFEGLFAPPYQVEKVFLFAPFSLQAARERLVEQWRQGAWGVVYSGHGGIDRLASEGLLVHADVPALDNGHRAPLVSAASCFLNFFAFPGLDSLGETLVTSPVGGAAAVVAASGLPAHGEAIDLQTHFLEALISEGHGRLGDALLEALRHHADVGGLPETSAMITLLGDPALKMPRPEP